METISYTNLDIGTKSTEQCSLFQTQNCIPIVSMSGILTLSVFVVKIHFNYAGCILYEKL